MMALNFPSKVQGSASLQVTEAWSLPDRGWWVELRFGGAGGSDAEAFPVSIDGLRLNMALKCDILLFDIFSDVFSLTRHHQIDQSQE